jgi:hypothetical protein
VSEPNYSIIFRNPKKSKQLFYFDIHEEFEWYRHSANVILNYPEYDINKFNSYHINEDYDALYVGTCRLSSEDGYKICGFCALEHIYSVEENYPSGTICQLISLSSGSIIGWFIDYWDCPN